MSAALLLPLGSLLSEQLGFERREMRSSVAYDVTYRDAAGNREQLRFSLPVSDIRWAFQNSPDPSGLGESLQRQSDRLVAEANEDLHLTASELQARSTDLVRARARELEGDGPVRIAVTDTGDSLEFEATADGRFSKAEAAKVSAEMDRVLREIKVYSQTIQENISVLLDLETEMHETTIKNENGTFRERLLNAGLLREDKARGVLRVDYAAATRLSVSSMHSVAKALAQAGGDERELFAAALAFVQSIPYNTLQTREVNTGMGFLLPSASIDLNRGDCDTKSVVLAAILKTLLPRRSSILVVLRKHALLAVDLPVREGDRFLQIGGRKYLLVEPAGPGLYPVGKIEKDSARQIDGSGIEELIPLGS